MSEVGFEQQLEAEFQLKKDQLLSSLRRILSTLETAEEMPSNVVALPVVSQKQEIFERYIQKLRDIQETIENSTRKNAYAVTEPLAAELLSVRYGHVLQELSGYVFGDSYRLGNDLLQFCNAVRPFRDIETHSLHILMREVLPQLKKNLDTLRSSLGSSYDAVSLDALSSVEDREYIQQEIDRISDIVEWIGKKENQSDQLLLFRWLHTAFSQPGTFYWVDQNIKDRIASLLPPTDGKEEIT